MSHKFNLRGLALSLGATVSRINERSTRAKTAATPLLLLLLPVVVVTAKLLPWCRVGFDMARSASAQTAGADQRLAPVRVTRSRDSDLIPVPAGTVQIGDDSGAAGEYPAFEFTSQVFLMDRTPVTVAQFAAFVKDTDYRTDAERYGFGGVLNKKKGAWVEVRGATWRHPLGSRESLARGNHPVTQVSWFDANAFCRAYGLRLPTEFEWERAARLGQTPDGHVFKAGDPIELGHRYLLNAWEGTFPLVDSAADGYRTTSPVGAFGTAPSGLADMAGNVWEWTSSWYLPYGAPQPEPKDGAGERVSRGGSFLCSPKFCQGYRASARNHTTPDTSLENIGFRCVTDPARVTSLAGRVLSHPFNPANRNRQLSLNQGDPR
jgi:formylglycine-generating enzyme